VEVHPGVFVSNISTEEFEPDPEVSGEVHMLCSVPGTDAGMSRFRGEPGAEPVVYTTPARETLLVLEGEARIEIEGGPTLDLKPGDMASLPAGAVTTWRVTPPFKEFWVLA
jgi:uncharacterized cupin superfamily protein